MRERGVPDVESPLEWRTGALKAKMRNERLHR